MTFKPKILVEISDAEVIQIHTFKSNIIPSIPVCKFHFGFACVGRKAYGTTELWMRR